MKYEVFRLLEELRQESDKEYGKLIQKFLAIAFCNAFRNARAFHLIERSTQGIDLEITLPDQRRIAIEVKTTQDQSVKFGIKDLGGLTSQAKEDLDPYFALLGSQLLDEWILARYNQGEIRPEQQYHLTQLRAYRDRELEDSIREYFDEAVIQQCPSLPATNRQAALDQVLRTFPGYGTA